MDIVVIDKVNKVFRGAASPCYALRDVQLEISKGEILGITGPSGSGKSTLLNLIALLDIPTTGEVYLESNKTSDLSEHSRTALRAKKVGVIFQRFNLLPVLSALENVMLPLQIIQTPYRIAKQKAMEWLTAVGLGDQLDKRPDHMSGGQQQRVAIARALVTSPALVIADEPTANLDTETSREILSLIQKLNRDHCVTIVIATHDSRLFEYLSRVVEIRDGVLRN